MPTSERSRRVRSGLDVLAATERLLAVTGDAVALCPTYGEAANR
jgi:hypothetical protein